MKAPKCNVCFLILLAVLVSGIWTVRAQTPSRVWGVEFEVEDLSRAADYYTAALAFREVERESSGRWALLTNQRSRLLLTRSDQPAPPKGTPRPYLNMRTSDLQLALKRTLKAGAYTLSTKPKPNAIGSSILIEDPFGYASYLMNINGGNLPPGSPPRVFNLGLNVGSIEEAEPFYLALGLDVMTRAYLPGTLVFARNGGLSFVIHSRQTKPAVSASRKGCLIVQSEDARDRIASHPLLRAAVQDKGPLGSLGQAIRLRDSSGHCFKVVEGRPKEAVTGQ